MNRPLGGPGRAAATLPALVLAAVLLTSCVMGYPPPPALVLAEPASVPGAVSTAWWDVSAQGYADDGQGLDYSRAGLLPVLIVVRNKTPGYPLIDPAEVRGLAPGREYAPYPPYAAADVAEATTAFEESAKAAFRGGAAGAIIGAGVGTLLGAAVGGGDAPVRGALMRGGRRAVGGRSGSVRGWPWDGSLACFGSFAGRARVETGHASSRRPPCCGPPTGASFFRQAAVTAPATETPWRYGGPDAGRPFMGVLTPFTACCGIERGQLPSMTGSGSASGGISLVSGALVKGVKRFPCPVTGEKHARWPQHPAKNSPPEPWPEH